MEDVLVEIVELRRDADQAGGVGRRLEIDLEALQPRGRQGDMAVDGIRRRRGKLDPYAAEQLDVAEAVVGIVDRPLLVQASRADGVDVGQELVPERQPGGPLDPHVPDPIAVQRTGALRGLVSGVLAHLHLQHHGIPARQGVRLEIIIVLGEAVVPLVAHRGSGPGAFRLQGLLREPVPGLDGDVERIVVEILGEGALLRDIVDQMADLDPIAGHDAVQDRGPALLQDHLAVHLGVIIAQVAQVILDLAHRHADEPLLEDRLPAIAEERLRLLLDIVGEIRLLQVPGLVFDIDPVADQGILAFGKFRGRPAGGEQEDAQKCGEGRYGAAG